MQQAPLPEDAKELLDTIERNRRNTVAARAEFGFFEAWKRVADRKIDLLFSVIYIDGPTIPDDLREDVIESIHRFTLPEAFEGMTEEERSVAWRENRDAMDRYASSLADRAAAEQWERDMAVPIWSPPRP